MRPVFLFVKKDEVILKVSSKELSKFPCPFSIEIDCGSDCDNSEKVKTNEQSKIGKLGRDKEKSKEGNSNKDKKTKEKKRKERRKEKEQHHQ